MSPAAAAPSLTSHEWKDYRLDDAGADRPDRWRIYRPDGRFLALAPSWYLAQALINFDLAGMVTPPPEPR